MKRQAVKGEVDDSISIALCTYNGAPYLREQLESIAGQTCVPAELVVCDDGSTDGTRSILDQFCLQAGFPVRVYVNESQLGATKNFEQAIARCQGAYVALCDQDDWWYPNKLEVLREALRGSEAGGVFSDGLLMNEGSLLTGGTIWEGHRFRDLKASFAQQPARESAISVLMRENVVTGATLMFRAGLRPKVLPFPRNWIHDGWLAWMLVLHSSLYAVTEPLIRYRVHGTQQVGVPDYSAGGKWRRRANIESQRRIRYGSQLQQFETLRGYLMEHPAVGASQLRETLERKCRHLSHRATLDPSRLRRWRAILAENDAYQHFSQGWRSMLLDGLL